MTWLWQDCLECGIDPSNHLIKVIFFDLAIIYADSLAFLFCDVINNNIKIFQVKVFGIECAPISFVLWIEFALRNGPVLDEPMAYAG